MPTGVRWGVPTGVRWEVPLGRNEAVDYSVFVGHSFWSVNEFFV